MFTERVQLLVKSKNVTVAKMLKDLKLGTGTFTTWCSRGTIPSGEILSKIADYFDCSVDYLLGRTDIVSYEPAPASGELSEHERLVLEAYRNNTAMQSAVDKLLNVPTDGISIAEDISETIRKIESVSKADISKK